MQTQPRNLKTTFNQTQHQLFPTSALQFDYLTSCQRLPKALLTMSREISHNIIMGTAQRHCLLTTIINLLVELAEGRDHHSKQSWSGRDHECMYNVATHFL